MTGGIFQTLSNNKAFYRKLFPSKIFDWVLNTPLMTTSLAITFHFHIRLVFHIGLSIALK